jgi:hypothetical protein
MRKFTIPFNAKSIESFSQILTRDANDFEVVFDLLSKIRFSDLKKSNIVDILNEKFPSEFTNELFSFVIGMRGNIENQDYTTEELLTAIGKGLELYDKDNKTQHSDIFIEKREIFEKLIKNKTFSNFYKARSLMLSDESHLHRFSIHTHLTPVFDNDRANVIGNVIKNVANITISDTNEDEKIFIVPLGMQDLIRIKNQVEIAMKKMKTMEDQMTQSKIEFINYNSHP